MLILNQVIITVSLGARPFPLVEGNLHPRALVISSLHLKNSQIKSRPRDLAPYPDLLKSDRQNINNTPCIIYKKDQSLQ